MEVEDPIVKDVRLTNFDSETTDIFQVEFESVFGQEIVVQKADEEKKEEDFDRKEELLQKEVGSIESPLLSKSSGSEMIASTHLLVLDLKQNKSVPDSNFPSSV